MHDLLRSAHGTGAEGTQEAAHALADRRRCHALSARFQFRARASELDANGVQPCGWAVARGAAPGAPLARSRLARAPLGDGRAVVESGTCPGDLRPPTRQGSW